MLTWIWIGWRSIQQRGLASCLTAASMALGVALVVAVLAVVGVVEQSFKNNSSLGYNVIVGAKGGDTQIVLNSVYYLDKPVENLPYAFYQEFLTKEQRAAQLAVDPATQVDGKFAAYVALAIPICMGDYYKQYRVVGTIPEMFDALVWDVENNRKYEFAAGRNFVRHSPEHQYFEAVIGANVARETGLKVGDKFAPTHGSEDGDMHDPFTIVGILAPSGTPNDRALFVNMEGFYLMEGHAKPVDEEPAATPAPKEKKYEPLPVIQREVTAILVRTIDPLVTPGLRNAINEGPDGRAVLPVAVIYSLFELTVRPIQNLLLVITVMICLVSGISILVSIYNSMSERRQEIAIMRALGASRVTVSGVVLMESAMLALGGGLAGWLAGHVLIWLANPWIEYYSGVRVGLFELPPGNDFISELLLIPGLMVLALIVGFLPAVTAYETDVSRNLAK